MKPEEEKRVEEANIARDKIRYCSGDSIDSSHVRVSNGDHWAVWRRVWWYDDEDMKTEDSCDEDLQVMVDILHRMNQEEEDNIDSGDD